MGSSKGGRGEIDKNTNMSERDGPSSAALSPLSLTRRTALLNTELIAAEISCETLQETTTQNTCPASGPERDHGNLAQRKFPGKHGLIEEDGDSVHSFRDCAYVLAIGVSERALHASGCMVARVGRAGHEA